jgi:hypothetical protein
MSKRIYQPIGGMRKLRDKEEAMRNYYEVQRRQLEIHEANAPRRWSSSKRK